MSVEPIFEPWDAGDPLARGVDAGGVAVFAEFAGELLAGGGLSRDGLDLLRRWLTSPRWAHCGELAVMPVALLLDRCCREIARRSGPEQEQALLAYYRGRGELVDPAPDDASGLG